MSDSSELTDEEGRTYFDINLENVEDQRLAAEEYIAFLAQQEVKPSWWKELLQKIRMAFAKLPYFKDVRMTDKQIDLILARSARKVRKGGAYQAQDGGGKVGKPDTNGEVGTQSAATQPEPTFSRQELGAGLLNNIQQNPDNANGTNGNERERTDTDGNRRPYYDIPFADSVDAVMNNSYSGNGSVFMRDTPQIFMDMGFYVSYGGAITFKNANGLLECVKNTTIDRIMLETDCPYMTPVPYRGTTNYPKYIPLVAEKLCELKNIKMEELEEKIQKNVKNFFKID